MKDLLMVLGLSLALGGIAQAKPNLVKGAKCVACHTEAIGKKTNISPTALDMKKKYPDKKCTECHGVSDDHKKLTCTNAKLCKKK